jgi:hypothetical protein
VEYPTFEVEMGLTVQVVEITKEFETMGFAASMAGQVLVGLVTRTTQGSKIVESTTLKAKQVLASFVVRTTQGIEIVEVPPFEAG